MESLLQHRWAKPVTSAPKKQKGAQSKDISGSPAKNAVHHTIY